MLADEPAYIAFSEKDQILIGTSGINQNKSFFNLKRLLGTKMDHDLLKKHAKYLPFHVIEQDKTKLPLIQLDEKQLKTPEYLLAKILKKMVSKLPDHIKKSRLEAVVSVSSHLSFSREKALKSVLSMANIQVKHLLSNSKAISLAHYYKNSINSNDYYEEKIALYLDLGGGKFEASLLGITSLDLGQLTYKLYASICDDILGSIDFEDRIIEFLIKAFYKKNDISLRKNHEVMKRLRQASNEALHYFESKSEVNIKIDRVLANPDYDLDETLTRTQFQSFCEDLFNRSLTLVKNLFENTAFNQQKVDEIILVGPASWLIKNKIANADMAFSEYSNLVIGVALEAAFSAGTYKNKDDFIWLDLTRQSERTQHKNVPTDLDEHFNGIVQLWIVTILLGVLLLYIFCGPVKNNSQINNATVQNTHPIVSDNREIFAPLNAPLATRTEVDPYFDSAQHLANINLMFYNWIRTLEVNRHIYTYITF